MQYRRAYIPGGSYFFTVVTAGRRPLFENDENVCLLREAFIKVKVKHPFSIDAIVIMPDHIHTVWTLPEGVTDYSLRWRLIKTWLSKSYKGTGNVWQSRFWEHAIRDQEDFNRHIDYIHYNPVKHGLVHDLNDWENSSFHRYVASGAYQRDWGMGFVEIDGIGSE